MNLVCLFFLFIYVFFCFVLCRNSRWPPKVAGKRFLLNIASRLCRYPTGQKFLTPLDKRIFVFNTEIKDSRQKWRENVFFFCEIMPVDSRSVSKINMFLHFTQKFKVAGRQFLRKVASRLYNTLQFKNSVEIALSRSVSEINKFFAFKAEIQDGGQKWQEIANLISKLNFYKLIPYPMDNCLSSRRRPARQTPEKHVLCFHWPGRSQYCAFARWRIVFASCLDNVTSYHLFRCLKLLDP